MLNLDVVRINSAGFYDSMILSLAYVVAAKQTCQVKHVYVVAFLTWYANGTDLTLGSVWKGEGKRDGKKKVRGLKVERKFHETTTQNIPSSQTHLCSSIDHFSFFSSFPFGF